MDLILKELGHPKPVLLQEERNVLATTKPTSQILFFFCDFISIFFGFQSQE